MRGRLAARLRGLAFSPLGGDGARRVLVLQGERAVWTLWRDGRRIDERVERLDTDALAGCVCPWLLPDGETLVDVVADSPLDDIEQVLASGEPRRSGLRHAADPAPDVGKTRARAPGALARRLLARRLARRYPDARVRVAPADTLPLLAVLLRAELPEDWRRRLETLQRGPVTIDALHSAIRLHAPRPEERVGDVLRIVRGGGAERHLLLRSGCPAFTRVASVRDTEDSSTSAALDETLAHLALRHGIVGPRLHRSPDDLSGDAVTEAGGDVDGDDVADAHRLAALALGAGVRSGTRVASALLDKRRRHVELRRLHAATALTTVIAALTVLASAAHAIDSARRRARAVSAEQALVLHVERLVASIVERHPTPALADASLALIERRERSNAPGADDVLSLLAGVLTRHPSVRLDRVEWSTPESAADDARPGDAAALPPRRVRRAEEVGEPAAAWLEIAGRIDAAGALSIRERQRRFEDFVAMLENDERISALAVRRSPASVAAEGGTGTDEIPRVDYVLRLRCTTLS